MNKKIILIIAGLLLLTVMSGGGYYLYQRHQARALYEQAQKAYLQKDYKQALELCREITQGQLRVLSPMEQANILINAGNCLYEMDKYADSINYFARAAEIVENNDLLSKIEVPFRLYTRWGDCLEEKNINNAEKIYRHGIELFSKSYGVSYPGIAMLQVRLGNLYLRTAQYEKSLKCLEAALKNRRYIDEQDDSDRAYLYGKLAAAYCHNNKLNEALAKYQQSIEIIKKGTGENCPQIAIEYAGLALVYYKQKKITEAIKFLDLSYDIFREQCGGEYRATQRIAKLRDKWKLESKK